MEQRSSVLDGVHAGALIDRLAVAEHVSVFAGAGISVEAGLPAWPTLVERLLQRVARQTEAFRELRRGTGPEAEAVLVAAAQDFADAILRSSGPIAAASTVKAHLGDEYLAAVFEALYGPVDVRTLAPGPTALAIARFVLQTAAGEHPVVLTTNFDRLIEMAFEELLGPGGGSVRSTVPGQDPGDAAAVVVHLHGILDERSRPHERPAEHIVLSEDEFLVPGGRGPLLDATLRAELEKGPCVFLGTSMTDPNVLRILYELRQPGPTRHRHVTVAVAQTSAVGTDGRSEMVLAAQREGAARRLADAHVDALFVETYGEASQVFAELALQRAAVRAAGGEAASSVPPYARASWRSAERAQAFEQRALAAGLLPAEAAGSVGFEACQQLLQPRLAAAVGGIGATLHQVPALKSSDEQLALHLWIHSPERRLLALIGHSDRLSFNPATVQAAAARLPTCYLVVEAFCNGTVVEASDPALRSARWGSMLAVPLSSAEAVAAAGTTARIPAGVLVLASTKRGPAGLERLRAARMERAGLLGALRRLGEELLAEILEPHQSAPVAAQAPRRTLVPVGFDADRGGAHEDATPGVGDGTHISGAPPAAPDTGRWHALGSSSA